MLDVHSELTAFIRRYEQATNQHDFDQLAPLIAIDATYWFTDGSHHGIDAIKAAIEQTFAKIADEHYEIRDLEWVASKEDIAVCRYRFFWQGIVDSEPQSGNGRGTNVLTKRDGNWMMLHEHLSR